MGLFEDNFRYYEAEICLSRWRDEESVLKNVRIINDRIAAGEKFGQS